MTTMRRCQRTMMGCWTTRLHEQNTLFFHCHCAFPLSVFLGVASVLLLPSDLFGETWLLVACWALHLDWSDHVFGLSLIQSMLHVIL